VNPHSLILIVEIGGHYNRNKAKFVDVIKVFVKRDGDLRNQTFCRITWKNGKQRVGPKTSVTAENAGAVT
jgi:hypothetical protein